MNVTVETITPDQAKQWLGLNTHNRNLKDQAVLRLAAAIQRGEWELNGESIKLNGETLVDGQHRLAAIVKSGVPVMSVVVRGVPLSAQETIDTGARRTLSDMLKLRGEANHTALSTAVTFLHQLEEGHMGSGTKTFPTPQQAIALLERSPGLREGLTFGDRTRKRLRLSAGMVGALHFLFTNIDSDDANDFFGKLVSGANLVEGSPVLALRHAIERDATHLTSGSRKGYREMAALIIKAWNLYRAGKEARLLRWNPGGAHPEPFPVAR